MQECLKKREGNIGMAINGRAAEKSDTAYEDNDISATSNSLWRNMRKKVSSTGMLR